eukprot:839347-Pyramimonas_sp.AAC.2
MAAGCRYGRMRVSLTDGARRPRALHVATSFVRVCACAARVFINRRVAPNAGACVAARGGGGGRRLRPCGGTHPTHTTTLVPCASVIGVPSANVQGSRFKRK